MRIRFIHSVQAVGGRAFAKGELVDASEIPASYRAAWIAGGSAEIYIEPIILSPDVPLMLIDETPLEDGPNVFEETESIEEE